MASREYDCTRESTFNPFRDLTFAQAISSPASFYGMLALAAEDIGRLQGRSESPAALQYRGRSMDLIQKGIESSCTSVIESLIHAVALLVASAVSSKFLCHYVPARTEVLISLGNHHHYFSTSKCCQPVVGD